MNYIYFVVFLLFLIIGGYMTYQFLYNKKVNEKKFIPNKEFELKDKTNGDLYFFYTEWCPYSKKSEKVWDTIKRSYSSENLKLNLLKNNSLYWKDINNTIQISANPIITPTLAGSGTLL